MLRLCSRATRREFLQATTTALAMRALSWRQPSSSRETLYNGIVLPAPWPPRRRELSALPSRPPYLADPPAVIDIDVGRQLFVDDFLIEESALHRTFHRARYHPSNPVLAPERSWELRDPHAELTGDPRSPSAMPFSDGVFFDPSDRLFKMWYMAGYQQHTALALSSNGVDWDRPSFDVMRGTNVVFEPRRDSTTVWLDLDAADPAARYKMAAFLMEGRALRLYQSPDGIHWRHVGTPGPSGDRSTCFSNPFRNVWAFSLRAEDPSGLHRYRRYAEARTFADARWGPGDPVLWTGADVLDVMRAEVLTPPELYNLDAVAYESILLGLFTMYRGEQSDREKPNDVSLGFSRDGFHWARPFREPFITVSDRQGDWNWANVQSAGGSCLVVGDSLYFYVSGRAGVPGTSLPGVSSTGLATLRRDGFASVTDEWPSATARLIRAEQGTLTTRPLRFSGSHLFVNAAVAGELRVEILDRSGRVIEPFSSGRALPVSGDSTRHAIGWNGVPSVSALAGQPVRFRFRISRGRIYAFWVSPSATGQSGGYVAAGGPGFTRSRDAG